MEEKGETNLSVDDVVEGDSEEKIIPPPQPREGDLWAKYRRFYLKNFDLESFFEIGDAIGSELLSEYRKRSNKYFIRGIEAKLAGNNEAAEHFFSRVIRKKNKLIKKYKPLRLNLTQEESNPKKGEKYLNKLRAKVIEHSIRLAQTGIANLFLNDFDSSDETYIKAEAASGNRYFADMHDEMIMVMNCIFLYDAAGKRDREEGNGARNYLHKLVRKYEAEIKTPAKPPEEDSKRYERELVSAR